MKFKGWHGLVIGFAAGFVVAHLYHTQTTAPGSASRRG